MPTVIDELVVTLGLNAANFTKGQKDAAEALLKTKAEAARAAKEMQADGAKAAQFFSQIKTEALSLIGVLLGGKGIEAFARDATTSLAALGRAATNINVPVEELAAFQNMIERNGGSAQAATASLQGYAQAIERFRVYGDASVLQFLQPIGADVNESPIAVYMKFLKYVEEHKNAANGAQLINLIGKGLGYDQGLINASIQIGSVAKGQKELARSYELGVPNQEQIDRVTAMQEAFIGLGQAAEQAGNNLLGDMAPSLKKIADELANLIAHNPQYAEAILAIASALTVLAGVRLLAFLPGLSGLASLFDRLAAAATRLSALSLPLALSGDAGPDTATPEQKKKLQEQERPGEFSRSPAQWLRDHINNYPSSPIKRWLQEKFGTNAIADTGLAPEQQAFLKTLSDPESGGAYDVKNGGSTFSDFSQFPQGVGPGGTSSASGRYQFTADTWADVSRQLGLTDFTPASQDKAAWYLASQEYRKKTGRDLSADLKSGGHEGDIATALNGRWPSLPGGSQSKQSLGDFSGRLQGNLHASSPIVPPAPPPLPAASPTIAGGDTTHITVGSITVQTQATDAHGIAGDIHGALVDQANRGLN